MTASARRLGIPFVADRGSLHAANRQSFVRACAALVIAGRKGSPPGVLRAAWGGDRKAARVLRALL
jgi:hypothetical protein